VSKTITSFVAISRKLHFETSPNYLSHKNKAVFNQCIPIPNVSMVKCHSSAGASYVLARWLKLGIRIPVNMFSRAIEEENRAYSNTMILF
jgi:hypothetical protein